MKTTNYSETANFRCLNEYYPRQTDGVRLIMCGVENCAAGKGPESRVRDAWHLHVILSGAGALCDLHRCCSSSGKLFIPESDTGACCHGFHAAHMAAGAQSAVGLDDQMTELPGAFAEAAIQLAV